MCTQAVSDLRRVARVVPTAIEDYCHLLIAREGLNEVGIQIRLTPGDNDQPALGGVAVGAVLVRILHWFNGSRSLLSNHRARSIMSLKSAGSAQVAPLSCARTATGLTKTVVQV